MSVRINELKFMDPGYGPEMRARLVPRPGAKATAAGFDPMATLEDEGKTALEVSYGEERRILDPPPDDWRDWDYPRAKLAWDGAA